MTIKLLALDVDGVLTDGGVYYSANGEEMVKFNRQDGMGIKLLREAGIIVCWISGEPSECSRRRAEKLGIEEIHLGIQDKVVVLRDISDRLGIQMSEIAYIGDDVNDCDPLQLVGLPMTVNDGVPAVKRLVRHVLHRQGGHGAVREAADYILEYNNKCNSPQQAAGYNMK